MLFRSSRDRKACGKVQGKMFTVEFHNGEKELWLKATNQQQLTKLFGPHTPNWKDRWIWLYVTDCKSPNGGTTLGIRIRDRTDAPKTGEGEKQVQDSLKPDKLWKRLVEICGSEGIAKQTLQEQFGVTSFKGLAAEKAKEIEHYCDQQQGGE